jgi:hypothetical protein
MIIQNHVIINQQNQCNVSGWPAAAVVANMRFSGARERCFCGYAELSPTSPDYQSLSSLCPTWKKYVSTDMLTANKVSGAGTTVTVLGTSTNNVTTQKYGQMTDWSVDFGSGFGSDCNTTSTPGCIPEGSHVLSIPKGKYYKDCCTMDSAGTSSLAAELEYGKDPQVVCNVLRDLLSGGLAQVQNSDLHDVDSCREENQDPLASNSDSNSNSGGCLAQCFHYRPDVNWVHLHTTSSVKAMRDGPIDSGLGLGYNATEIDDSAAAFGRYNVCACEPSSWGPKRGNCPNAKPFEADYLKDATMSLCKNLAGVSGVDPAKCKCV